MSEVVAVTGEAPHVLWKQVLGLTIASVIFFLFGGIFLVLTGVFTFCDAWVSGIYRRSGVKSWLNISPMAWGIVMEGLLVAAYPVYLMNRNKLKTKGTNNTFWILAILFGALSLLVAVFQIVTRLQGGAAV